MVSLSLFLEKFMCKHNSAIYSMNMKQASSAKRSFLKGLKSILHILYELNPAAVTKCVILIMAVFILAGKYEVYFTSQPKWSP